MLEGEICVRLRSRGTVLPCHFFVHTRWGAAYLVVQGREGSAETLGDDRGGVREV